MSTYNPQGEYTLTGETVRLLTAMAREYRRSRPQGGTVIGPNGREDRQYFWGKIVTAGPSGEADYTDARYWVKRVFVNNSASATAELTTIDAAGDYEQTVTATCLGDLPRASHTLKEGQIVRVDWEWDASTPPQARYIIAQTAGGGGLVAVSLSKDGGSDGGFVGGTSASLDNGFSFPSYTYTALDILTSSTLGTGLSPQARVFPGSCHVAYYGIAYTNAFGDFTLLFAFEWPNVDICDNYDGEPPNSSSSSSSGGSSSSSGGGSSSSSSGGGTSSSSSGGGSSSSSSGGSSSSSSGADTSSSSSGGDSSTSSGSSSSSG